MNKPNLFVVGAMKCGTTILCDFLNLHEDIAVAPKKEVHYFSLNYLKGETWYLEQFQQEKPVKYTVDASPTYFDTSNTVLIASLIKSFEPNAKIIVIIRDPVDRLISHFNHQKRIAGDSALANVELTDLLDGDLLQAAIAPDRQTQSLRQMLWFSAYFGKLSHFISVFGNQNVLLLHNDDLRLYGQSVMNRVFDFLGVPRLEHAGFSEQRYLGPTKRTQISFRQEVMLYTLYGRDYLLTCGSGAARFTAAVDQRPSNQPAGAILGDVAIGEDGWLFLVRGSNDFLSFFLEKGTARRAAERWLTICQRRQQSLKQRGVDYLHLMVPEKLTIHSEKLPWQLDRNNSPGLVFSRLAKRAGLECCVNIFDIFRQNRNTLQLYFKTDSHWTHAGAFLAYQMLCNAMGIVPRNELLKRPFNRGRLVLDLGAKLPTPLQEEASFYKFVEEATLVERGPLVEFKERTGRVNDAGLHVGSLVRYENPQAPVKKRVLLFGDSFSECRQHLLSGLLAETVSEFCFIWSTNLDYGYIDRFQPDIVICAMTERFMRSAPEDDFELNTYVDKRLAEVVPVNS